jgi:hypothetical protein
MDMGRKFDVVTSPRDFRRSFDLPKTRKLDIGQIKTHSRSPSNSSEDDQHRHRRTPSTEDDLRHRRTPSQDFREAVTCYL